MSVENQRLSGNPKPGASVQYRKLLRELHDSLKRLAARPPEQAAYLKKQGVLPSADELALELDDVVALLPQFVERAHLTRQQAEAIQAVDRQLEEMSGPQHADLWTEDALHSRAEWEKVRQLAAVALRELQDTC